MSVEMSADVSALFAAMAAAQGEMTVAAKDREVKERRKTRDGREFTTSRTYATLESVQEATRPILSKNELTLTQWPETDERGRVVMHYILGHSSGQWIRGSMTGSTEGLQQSGVQALGSVMTYLRRYTWMSVCGIAQADEDDDGRAAVQADDRRQQRPKREEREERKPEPVAKGEHHPEWTAGANRWFFAQLGDLGVDYKTQLAPWHEKEHGSRPSQLPRQQLEKLVRHLRSDAGRGLVQWLREQGGAA